MAKRRVYKRDSKGRFAPTNGSRTAAVRRTVKRASKRVVPGSGSVRVGLVGPNQDYVGVRASAEVKPRKRRRGTYYVSATVGRKITR